MRNRLIQYSCLEILNQFPEEIDYLSKITSKNIEKRLEEVAEKEFNKLTYLLNRKLSS